MSNLPPRPMPMSLVTPSRHRVPAAASSSTARLEGSVSVPVSHARPDIAAIRSALAPEERLIALLQGVDRSGLVRWAMTPRRLILLPEADPADGVVQVPHAAITCVELRTDPLGTWLRVRATGRQLSLHTPDAAEATEFCTLLRERAGIGGSAPYAPYNRSSSAAAGTFTPPRLRQLR